MPLGSSPEAEAVIEADPATIAEQPDASTASSSNATENQGGDTLLASVEEALKASEPEKSPDSEADPTAKAVDPAKVDAEGKPKAPAEEPLGELTEDELRRFGPKTQRRMRQLLTQRAEANTELEKLKPRAESFDKIDQFVKSNRLSNADLAVIFEIGALVRNDPFKALEKLEPIYQQLQGMTGAKLPPDVQERVNLGYLTEADARELVKARKRVEHTEARTQEQTEQARETERRQAFTTHVNACRTTANKWESAKQSSDPDWNEKQSRIGELIELEVLKNGYPETQEGVVKMLDGFLTKVNAEFARFKPKPREVRPVIGSASSRATAEPKTLEEAVDRALAL